MSRDTCNCPSCRMLNHDIRLDPTPATEFKATCNCGRSRIVSMGNGSFTNSMCQSCGHRWYGHGEVKEYTRKEWFALVDSSLDEGMA